MHQARSPVGRGKEVVAGLGCAVNHHDRIALGDFGGLDDLHVHLAAHLSCRILAAIVPADEEVAPPRVECRWCADLRSNSTRNNHATDDHQ